MDGPRWLDDEEMAAWKAFLMASATVHRCVEHGLKEDAGLSHLQYEILVRLGDADEARMRMSDLAAALVNSPSGLTYQIGRMEDRGLVHRRACTSDERVVWAELTDEGRATLEHAAPGHVATVREALFDHLTPEQVAALADGLGAVARATH